MASQNAIGASPTPSSQNSPQAFGASGSEDPAHSAHFHPGQSASEDAQEAKRRRIARACDMCRKKKIKCDGKLPSCTHCANYSTECVFTLVEKKRNPPKGAKYIEGLENRLGRMESLLKLSGLLPEDLDGKTDLGDLERRLTEQTKGNQSAIDSTMLSTAGRSSSESIRTGSSTLQSSASSPTTTTKEKDEDQVENLSDLMCSLVTNNCGETRFIGSSSGFSIFSPKGIQWVNEKTGDTSFQEMIMNATSANRTRSTMSHPFANVLGTASRKPLPPKEPAKIIVEDFFINFNNLFPLFHKPTFEYLLDKHYSDDPTIDSGWYAAFNMVLAISCRLRISHPVAVDSAMAPWVGIDQSSNYFQNAAGVMPELLLRNSDLLTIQAILAMTLFMQGTANPQPSYFLIAAAVRIANSIGMHRRGNCFGLNPAEVEQRRRVFWIMYLLDKEMSLRSGRPGAINDDDINVELPDEDPPDGVGNMPLRGGKGKINLFRLLAQFSQIEGKVYMLLYSAKAARQSDQELLNTIGDLDRELEAWKELVPLEIRPEHEIKMDESPLVLHVVMLHFAYYNCLTTIHRMSIHHGYWTSRLSNYAISGLSARPLNPRVFSSAALCVSAARASIHLVKYINEKDCPCIWLIMYYPISALVTLFANILQNPLDPRARLDVRLMHDVCEFLMKLDEDDDEENVSRMVRVAGEFDRIAKVVLDKAEKEAQTRRKRKQTDDRDRNGSEGPRTPLPVGVTLNAGDRNPYQASAKSALKTANKASSTASASNTNNNTNQHTPSNQDSPMSTMDSSAFDSFSPSSNFNWLGDAPSPIPQPPQTPKFTFNQQPQSHLSPLASSSTTPYEGGLYSTISPSPSMGMPMGMDSFQQPFGPQDLWHIPMTLEWDWADINMSGMGWGGNPADGL
ncbi:fungal-specific transcription factor domain-containing protein [Peziza echinospora]|nr:fungal-specific transcription factor domain-containing protein [Peziza echinospora]